MNHRKIINSLITNLQLLQLALVQATRNTKVQNQQFELKGHFKMNIFKRAK